MKLPLYIGFVCMVLWPCVRAAAQPAAAPYGAQEAHGAKPRGQNEHPTTTYVPPKGRYTDGRGPKPAHGIFGGFPFPPRPPTIIPPVLPPVPVPPTVAQAGQTEIRDDLGVRVAVPRGWMVHEQLRSAGGPLNLNTFASRYGNGGMIPPGGATIDITRVHLRRPIGAYIHEDSGDATILGGSPIAVAGLLAREVRYIDQFGPGLAYGNVAVYVNHGDELFKFYLSYNEDDFYTPQFQHDFGQVLASAQFSR